MLIIVFSIINVLIFRSTLVDIHYAKAHCIVDIVMSLARHIGINSPPPLPLACFDKRIILRNTVRLTLTFCSVSKRIL